MDTVKQIMWVPVMDDATGDTFRIPMTKEEYEKADNDELFMLKMISEKLPQATADTPVEDEGSHQQTPEEPQEASDDCTDTSTVAGTLAFIFEFETFQKLIERGKLKQKDAFENVASNLKKKNIEVSAKQCATKLASLKRTYKKIKDHNAKSGNNRQTWQYFERMDNIYSKKPWIEPVAICSSEPTESEETKENWRKESERQPTRKRTKLPVDAKFDQIIEEVSKRREAQAAQHTERLQRMDRLLEILEKNSQN